ncbi:MAG: NAD(P)/FAD-dependent oxidoreductase [Lachnospiraceae bacterium]|nr:NAD(P)/FAD-dependent oxidoreductase [Lachnospiraceae bacterium]
MNKIIVIGGGAAGMLAAVSASDNTTQVVLVEKNEKLGKKLFITGKGRCNVTNSADKNVIMNNIVTNPKFMFSALDRFDNTDICNELEQNGCRLKEERGGRIFPVSDHSSDVIRALSDDLKKHGVEVRLNTCVKKINRTEDGFEVLFENGKKEKCSAVIIATGGVSYPATGSTGDGFRFASDLEHTITDTVPSLVPLCAEESFCRDLQGLSLKNTGLKMICDGKTVYEDMGEMLFTHFGISGPMVLSASSYYQKKRYKNCRIILDLKPALSADELDARLQREISENHEKHVINMLPDLLPQKMVPVIAKLSGVDPHKKCGDVTREERLTFAGLLKNLELNITGTRGFEEAIITKGGVNVKEIMPGTMMSKKCEGLFFAGEVMDLDALTGGFNLQIAWSTGYLAGVSAAEYVSMKNNEVK